MRDPLSWIDADGGAHGVRHAHPEPRAVLIVDAALTEHPVARAAARWLRERGCSTRVAAIGADSPGAGSIAGVEAVADLVEGTDLTVAVGGGSVLDAVKIGTLAAGNPRVLAGLRVPQRGGIVLIPRDAARIAPLVAVPTTLGTGAESSRVAVLGGDPGRRLVMGPALGPQARVLDPLATAGLPAPLIIEGLTEVLARVVGPYVGSADGSPIADDLVEVVAARLIRLGDQVSGQLAAGRAPSGSLRLTIARLSALSHGEWLARPADPYAVKGWLLANELAAATGVRKMVATGALWPALWTRIDRGDDRLGSAARLRTLWAILRAAHPGDLPGEPGPGIAALLTRWGVGGPLRVSGDQFATAVHAVCRRWGGGLPMLGGLRPADVRELLAATVDPLHEGAPLRRPA